MREFLILTLSLFVAFSTLEAEAVTTEIDSETSITNLVINPGDTLQINSGLTLIITGTVENFGTINNDGTILNFGTLNNEAGIIENNSGGTIENSGGTINNSGGFIINNAQGIIKNDGIINNEGILENLAGGLLDNSAGGTIKNDGIIDNDGTIKNNGIITSSSDEGNEIVDSSNGATVISGSAGGSSADRSPPRFNHILVSGAITQLDDGTFRPGNITSQEIKFSNSMPTAIVETGKPITISFEIFEDSGTDSLKHITLYTNLRDPKREVHYSDTRIIYNKGSEIRLVDANHFLSDANISLFEKGNNIEAVFNMTFQNPMELSDIIIRAWDERRNSIDVNFLDAIRVVYPSELADIELGPPKTTTIKPTESEIPITRDVIAKWAGLSSEVISDSELLTIVGLEGETIPSWFKSSIPAWIMQERTSQEEFVNALKFFYENGLLNSVNHE